jgi:hypothetical protein
VDSSSRDANEPPLSGMAFGGRYVARLTGTAAVELLDARTLEPVASVHVLKLPEDFGWVVHTPDGHWDASPGAEKYLAVFHNGRAVRPAEARSRRVDSLLRTRRGR